MRHCAGIACEGEPGFERRHRAGRRFARPRDPDFAALPLLIGFRPAHEERQARLGDGDIIDVERDELGAAHCGAKADQQKSAVAAASRSIDPQPAHDAPQVLGQQRALGDLAGA
jgi:hypothetical protein